MPIIGIDLGTTFSCAAYVDEHNHPEVVLNSEGQPITASAVWIDEDDNMIVGQLARDNAIAFPEDVITLAKRYIGQDIKLTAHGKEFTPQEVSAIILKKLKQDAERVLNTPVADAVITCPAFFGPEQIKATQEAGEMAGFNVRKIIPEPYAAALAFGYDHPEQMFDGAAQPDGQPARERTLLVYDLGGGTFDITLFQVAPPEAGSTVPKFTMISTEGNHQLGGTDWDSRIVDFVAEEFIRAHGKTILLQALKEKCDEEAVKRALDGLAEIPASPTEAIRAMVQAGLEEESVREALADVKIDPRAEPRTHQDLQYRAERAKIALSRVAKTSIVCLHAGLSHKVDLTRDQLLQALTADLLALTVNDINKLLTAKNYTPEQIDEVLLVGGSTRMVMVRDQLQQMFPGRVNTRIEADICVARGAARMARIIEEAPEGKEGDGGKEFLVSSHAYGLCALDKDQKPHIYPLILKDQAIPGRSAKPDEKDRPDYDNGTFHTGKSNMTRVVLEVYENDARAFDELWEPDVCKKIGRAVIENLPPNRPAHQEVYVTFSMDVSKRLTVEALDVSSGTSVAAEFTIQQDTTEEGLLEAANRKERMTRLLADKEVGS
jgi:molecular chaperone DnaK (HSP70)